MRFVWAGIILAVAIPSVSYGAVHVSEIAWAGSSTSANDEWLELSNDGSTDVSLSGWKLKTADGGITISLSGTIRAGGFYLLERTDDSTVPNIEADQLYTGALSNVGETLTLEDASGNSIETLSFSSGWPTAGMAVDQTMQWTGSMWIAALGTPKAHTVATTSSVSGENQPTGGGAVAKGRETKKVPLSPSITLAVPSELYQDIPYIFNAQITLSSGYHPTKGPIEWNFGDGSSVIQDVLAPIEHSYDYPGTYTVWVGYYRGEEVPYLSASKTIKVTEAFLSLLVVGDGKGLEITNQSGSVVDLSSWSIYSKGFLLPIPEHTILAADASVVFSAKALGIDYFSSPSLTSPTGGISFRVGVPATTIQKLSTAPASTAIVLAAQAPQMDDPIFAPVQQRSDSTKSNRTKKIIFSAIAFSILVLFILLQRFMAKRE